MIDPPSSTGEDIATLPPRPVSVEAWTGIRRILAIRLDAAGDVLMTSPALRALRATGPDRLTLLTSPAGAAAANLLPELDSVIAYDAPWMKAATPTDPLDDAAMIERLAAERFDGAVIFTVHSQSPLPAALMTYLARIPRRLAHCRENPYQLLTDWVPEPEPDTPIRHEVRRQLDLLEAVGIEARDSHMSLHVPDVASRRARERLAGLGIRPGEPWLLAHPGATAPSRRYPPDRFGRAIRDINAMTCWPVVLTGSASERDLVGEVRAAADGIGDSLAGEVEFDELAALIAIAPMILTNNSVPAHIAAAVGTPVVDLYALTNLQHTPWQVPARVLSVDVPCKGCRRSVCPLGHNRCIRAIEPSVVAEAVLELAADVGIPLARPARELSPERLLAYGK
jgi:lipopolysaccharide heptosyltransferase II